MPLPPVRIETVPLGDDAIGGYFAMEPAGQSAPTFHARGYAFQSGRAAFLALLESARPRRAWLPWYLCDSMAEPLAQAGVACQRYGLAGDFSSFEPIPLQTGDLLLAVNYFGLMDREMDRLVSHYDPSQLVIDNSQAFYSAPRAVLGNIYSPRKFMGVPDGGYLITDALSVTPRSADTGSRARSTHLTKRRDQGAEAGYTDFCAAEATLSGLPALAMSQVTRALMATVPHDVIRERRRRNFAFLAERLDPFNQLVWAPGEDAVPLCYPFLPRGPKRLREALWAARIYAACYWPELLDSARPVPETERCWARELIALPVDQRYDPQGLDDHLLRPLLKALA